MVRGRGRGRGRGRPAKVRGAGEGVGIGAREERRAVERAALEASVRSRLGHELDAGRLDLCMDPMERMGRELKCPICWSLYRETVGLSACSHNFCRSCILESMKRMSCCPVCKQPTTRREIRPAPHLDNLVAAYRVMEKSLGFNLFCSQPYAGEADSLIPDEGRKNCRGIDVSGAENSKCKPRKAGKKHKTTLAFADITNGDGQGCGEDEKLQELEFGGRMCEDVGNKVRATEHLLTGVHTKAAAPQPFRAFVPVKKRVRVHVPHFARNEVTSNDTKQAAGVSNREPRRGPMRGKRSIGGKLLAQPGVSRFLLPGTSDANMCTSNERDPSGRDLSIALLLERSKETDKQEAVAARGDRLAGNRYFDRYLAPRPTAVQVQEHGCEELSENVQLLSPSSRPHITSPPSTAGEDDPSPLETIQSLPATSSKDMPLSRPACLTPFQSKRWSSGPETDLTKNFSGGGTWTLQGCSSSIVNKLPNGQIVMASNSIVQAHSTGRSQLPPLFWLGDVIGSQDMTQPTPTLPSQFSLPRPSFDDLKECAQESAQKEDGEGEEAKTEAAAEIDSFDSDVFAWTQHPCSPELNVNLRKVQVILTEATSPSRPKGAVQAKLIFVTVEDDQATGGGNATAKIEETAAVAEKGRAEEDVDAPLLNQELGQTRRCMEEEEEKRQRGLGEEEERHNYEQEMMGSHRVDAFQNQRKRSRDSPEAETSLSGDQMLGESESHGAEGDGVRRPKSQRRKKKVQWDRYQNNTSKADDSHCVSRATAAEAENSYRKRKNAGGSETFASDSTQAWKRAAKFGGDDAMAAGMEDGRKAPKIVPLKRSKIRRNVDAASAQYPPQPRDVASRTSDVRREDEAEVVEAGEGLLRESSSLLTKSLAMLTSDSHLVEKAKEAARCYSQVRECGEAGEGESDAGEMVCSFCRQAGDNQVAGELLEYVSGSLAPLSSEASSKAAFRIYVHKKCADWAPAVYFEDDQMRNLEAEISRALKIKCSICGLRGAALGCYNGHCRKSFHFPCARGIPGCKWEDDIFVIRCPAHAAWKLGEERKVKPIRRKSKPSTAALQSPLGDAPTFHQAGEGTPASVPPRRSAVKARPREALVEATEQHSESIPFPKWPSGPAIKWVLSGSGLDTAEKEQLASFVAVTGASLSKSWSPTVTHVVAGVDESGSARRTLKFLMATLEGRWIVKSAWMAACSAACAPVREDQFEVTSDTHGMVDGPKRGRELAAINAPKILHGFALYFCPGFETAYKADLQALILAAGGRILHRKPAPTSLRDGSSRRLRALVLYNSDVSVAGSLEERQRIMRDRQQGAKTVASRASATALPHTWLLDSVAGCRLQPI